MQSSGRSTCAPRGGASSWTKEAEDVPRRAVSNSTTSRASRARTSTPPRGSGWYAAATTCMPPSSCTGGPTWNGCVRTSSRRGLLGRQHYCRSRTDVAPGRAPSGRSSEHSPRLPLRDASRTCPEARAKSTRGASRSSALRQRAGETEPEPAAVGDRALDSDGGAVRLDDLARDHQAETAADDARAAGGAGEALEDAGELVGGDAGAVVLDAGRDEGGLHLDGRLDRPRRRGELDRVAEQVRDHLREAARVAHHARRGVRLDGAHVQL